MRNSYPLLYFLAVLMALPILAFTADSFEPFGRGNARRGNLAAASDDTSIVIVCNSDGCSSVPLNYILNIDGDTIERPVNLEVAAFSNFNAELQKFEMSEDPALFFFLEIFNGSSSKQLSCTDDLTLTDTTEIIPIENRFDDIEEFIIERSTVDTLKIDNCTTRYINNIEGKLAFAGIFDFTFSNPALTVVTDTTVFYRDSILVYTISDTITVIDDTPPTFTYIPPDQTIECGTFVKKDYRAQTVDACTDDVQISNDCPTSTDPQGNIIHTFLWKAEDRCGNVARAETKVTERCETPPPPTGCDALAITPSTNSITITNLNSPNKIVKIYRIEAGGGWVSAGRCSSGDCQTTQVFDNLTMGTYVVEIQLYDRNWQQICTISERNVVVGGSSQNTGGSNSNGGGGQSSGNNDNGGPTDGGNTDNGSNTTGDCSTITYQTTDDRLTIGGLRAPIVDLKVFNRSWQQIYDCSFGDCPETVVLDNLQGGTHRILTKLYSLNDNGGWEFICRTNEEVLVSGAAGSRNSNLANFDLYPNPAREFVAIDMWEYRSKTVDIRIYNAVAKEVYQQKIGNVTEEVLRIPLDDFTNGMHFVHIQGAGLRSVAKKLMVTKMY
ncbi:MAG: T9SS type A sorting domain-containing protein [Bacteroidota bacterium]